MAAAKAVDGMKIRWAARPVRVRVPPPAPSCVTPTDAKGNQLTHVGHDNQHRIFKFFAWEEAKTKATNGGYVDYPKLANTKLESMTTAEIGKLLMVSALASDLFCPTYSSGATLAKDSKLAKEAAHYKVHGERIFREVRETLARKSSMQKPHLNC